MDTTQVIILTMIVNIIISGLVGGIVIYTIQKKIDATTQKSIFEHQIKFARSFPKILEVLEAFTQLLIQNSRRSTKVSRQIVFRLTGEIPVDSGEFKTAKDELFEEAGSLSGFILNNRLHLPDDLIQELEAISYRAFKLMLVSLANDEASNDTEEKFIEHFVTCSLFIGVPIDEITHSREKDIESLVRKIGNRFAELVEQSEKIYKSVAKAQ